MVASEVWRQTCLHRKCELLSVFNHGLLAICKPVGLLSHPNNRMNNVALSSSSSNAVVLGRFNDKRECFVTPYADGNISTYLLHRLDKGTSGVMLLSSDQSSASVVKSLFKERKVKKEYFALVNGLNLLKGRKQALWEDDYEKVQAFNSVRAKVAHSMGAGGAVARTTVFVEAENRKLGLSLLRMQPHTGFSHQLRFQCAIRHAPILGDDVYGNFLINKEMKLKRLYLHSHHLSFEYPSTSTHKEFVVSANSPIPDDFSVLLVDNSKAVISSPIRS